MKRYLPFLLIAYGLIAFCLVQWVRLVWFSAEDRWAWLGDEPAPRAVGAAVLYFLPALLVTAAVWVWAVVRRAVRHGR